MKRPLATLLAGALVLLSAVPALAAQTVLVNDDISDKNRYTWSGNPQGLPYTTAVVDTTLHEIRIGEGMGTGHLVDSRPGTSLGLVVVNGNDVESYVFDGVGMTRVDALSFTAPDGVGGVAAKHSPTSVMIFDADSGSSWHFNGESMLENPLLGITGLTDPKQIATRPGQQDAMILDGNELKGYSFTGDSMVQNPNLSLTGLEDPVAFAVHPKTQDVVVIDGRDVVYYNWTGAGLVKNEDLSIHGLDEAIAVQIAADGTLYIADSDSVDAYSYDGTGYQYNEAFSVTHLDEVVSFTVMGDNSTLAVRFPTEVRFYQFDGVRREENRALRITDLEAPLGGPSGTTVQAVSVVFPVSEPAEAAVLDAKTYVPEGTSVRFQVSNDLGETWMDITKPGRGAAFPEPSSAGVMWRAILSRLDESVESPKVLPNIVLMQVHRPEVTSLRIEPIDADGVVRTGWPTIRWAFSDADTDDYQTAYQVVLYDMDTGATLYDTGKVSILSDPAPPDDEDEKVIGSDPRGSQLYHALVPEAFAEGYRFQYKVRVWDKYDIPSEWSSLQSFEVLALYDVTITDIVHPPASAPELPTQFLPVPIKAGARFAYHVDSVGAVREVTVTYSDGGFDYLSPRLPTSPTAPMRNTWDGSYYTQPDLEPGTILYAHFVGTRADGRQTELVVPIVATEGSIFEDFTVILTN